MAWPVPSASTRLRRLRAFEGGYWLIGAHHHLRYEDRLDPRLEGKRKERGEREGLRDQRHLHPSLSVLVLRIVNMSDSLCFNSYSTVWCVPRVFSFAS